MHYNLVNESMSVKKSSKTPKVGMCATMFCGSDRWPMVITEVISKSTVRAAMMSDTDYRWTKKEHDSDGNEFLPSDALDNYTKTDPVSLDKEPTGRIYSFRKNHRWVEKGNSMWSTGVIHLGEADEYRDPNF